MHNIFRIKKFLLALALALPLFAAAQDRAAFGPIENVGRAAPAITVLGQRFAISPATKIAVNGRSVPRGRAFELLTFGQRVLVQGKDSPNGTVATSIDVAREAYVPGATPVYVYGVISSAYPVSGLISIGNLQIDTTALAPEHLEAIRIGVTVELIAIQPVPSGVLISPNLLSIGGSGSQLQSIGGSGAQLESIGGSGVKVQSIGGSGVAAQSIGGSGSQLQSIGGSGVKSESIGGSGSMVQSIGGSGVQLQSIGGSGIKAESIGGSGMLADSIGGSGSL
jgi:hypothetical protein